MTSVNSADKLEHLLAPLYEAGWQDFGANDQNTAHPVEQAGFFRVLQRTCLVLGVSYLPNKDQLDLVPVAGGLSVPDDGIGLHDAVPKKITLKPTPHGLVPLIVGLRAAHEGLIDPSRFTMAPSSPVAQAEFLRRLYVRYIGQDAVDYLGGRTLSVLKRIDADEHLSATIKALMHLAPDVMPDPVPMAAAIGITLDCWRHTEIENVHAGSQTLNDAVMARLSISTTKAVSGHITTAGVDWEAVSSILTNPQRRIAHALLVRDFIGNHWPEVRQSIERKLDRWQHIENLVGPRATLRLLSVMGSTDYTKRWWGNSWWPDFASSVLHQVKHHTDLIDHTHDPDGLDLLSDVQNQPDELPTETLAVLIDPPSGKGLRYAAVAMPRVHVIEGLGNRIGSSPLLVRRG